MTRRLGSTPGLWRKLFAESTEAAAALLVVADGFVEVFSAEVGPEDWGEPELAVRRLPQEEVAQALLAAGSDDEVGVGHVGVGQALRDGLGGDLPLQLAGFGFLDDLLHGVGDLDAASVVEGDREGHLLVVLRQFSGDVHLADNRTRHSPIDP